MRRRRDVAGEFLAEQCAIVGANIRALRQRKGWSQAKLGPLMGWRSASIVCAAEGRRHPPAGFACLTCGAEAMPIGDLPNSVPGGRAAAHA